MSDDLAPVTKGTPLGRQHGGRGSARLLAAADVARRVSRIFAQLIRSATIDAQSSEAGAGFGIFMALAVWLVAAHTFDAEALGTAAALLSGTVVVGLICAVITVPWLRRGPRRVVPYAAAAAIAFVLGAGLAFGASVLSPWVASVVVEPWRILWFAASAAAVALLLLARDVVARRHGFAGFALMDGALAAGVVALLVLTDQGDGWAIFSAWSAPLPVVAVLAIVAGLGFPRGAYGEAPKGATAATLLPDRDVRAPSLGTVVMMVALGAIPLQVLNAAEGMAAAAFCLPSAIAMFLVVLSRGASLDHLPGRLRLMEGTGPATKIAPADAFVRTLALLVPCVALMLLFAPQIMTAFALDHIPASASVLRLLALAGIPAALLGLVAALYRAQERAVLGGIIEAIVPVVMMLLAGPVLDASGVEGLAAAWLAAYAILALSIGAILTITAAGRDAPIGWLLALATAGARLLFAAGLADRVARRAPADADSLRQLLASSDEPQASSWHQLGMFPSGGDVLIEFLGDEVEGAASSGFYDIPPGTRAFLKRSLTAEGMRNLERQHDNLQRISEEPRLAGCGVRFPQIIAFRRSADVIWSVERAIAGVDGRIVLRDPRRRSAAVAAACAAIDDIHGRTATVKVVDDEWIDRWVRHPASLLRLARHTLMSPEARIASIDAFIQRQRSHWLGRSVPMGYYHGDFSPGNVLYVDGTVDPVVNGIIDWDRTGWDGPRGYDACHFLLAARRADTGEQTGEIVRELLLAPASQRAALGFGDDSEAAQAMLGLAWLKLVSGNIEKSQKFTVNRLWSTANVDRVLQLFGRRGPLA